ncbi:hypothetical protein VTN77DRAFT_4489 [Rasamsonia byssochlamydoides]|uniref:uncharacterized protein n=1 Tax=Rasamsonia byssochlamydoides TaxID=89139 RepID=UPI0037424514
MSASGDFGPAPPGVDLAENQNAEILGAVTTLMIIGTGAVALRVLARMKTKNVGFAIDDYLIFCALFFSYGNGILCFVSIPYGNGRHLQVLTTDEFIKLWKVLFAYVIIYATAVTCTKSSIIMFYRRIFQLHYSLYFAMFFVIGYWITVTVTILVGCRPLPYFWEQYIDPSVGGVCINVNKFFFGNGIAAMLIDVIILCVPMPIIKGLQMPTSQKFAVAGILLLGSFVCVASIVRIVTLDRISSTDPTWTMAPVFVWSCVEPFIGIVCACLPTYGPFIRRWRSKSSNSKNSRGINNNSSTSSSGLRFSKKTAHRRTTDYTSLGDEVQLTNEISVTGPASSSMRTKGSDEELGYPMTSIMVREDVNVTWSNSAQRGKAADVV